MFNALPPAYEAGDVIEYQTFGGGSIRRVLVEYREDNIKNGRPGFHGTAIEGGADEGMSVWGYDDQIIRVTRRAA
jgi:hypothetical protein